MNLPPICARVLASILAVCLLCLSAVSAEAARIDHVDKDSAFARHFKVVVKQEKDEVRVTVTVPKTMQGHNLSSLTMFSNKKVQIRTNGTELEFVIEKKHFKEAFVSAGYLDPNRKPDEDGGFWAFQLDISSLSGADKE